MDNLEIQALKGRLVQEADVEALDQEVILVLLDIKGPMVTKETLDITQVHLVFLEPKVFLDDQVLKVNQELAERFMNQDLLAYLVPQAIEDPQGALVHQDHQGPQAHQVSKEGRVPAHLARLDLLDAKERKEERDCKVQKADLEAQDSRVQEVCLAEGVQVMWTFS